MQRFLGTPEYDGYFDFFSNIVVLSRYTALDLSEIHKAIEWVPGDVTPLNSRGVSIRALLKHEITHFLDMTTTAWGSQYIHRKLLMIKAMSGPENLVSDAQEVFMLDTAEVDIHSALILIDSTILPSSCDTLRHELRYTNQFGTCLIVHYLFRGKTRYEVPLSMLSLLEANATASEYLSEIADAESIECLINRSLTEREIERRFNLLLDDSQRLEYSLLLRLTKIHFEQISLREMLALVAALCRFSLDATDIGMAAMANIIEDSALNFKLGRSIAMELRRGSQRQLIFFKTVLFMYEWMSKMNTVEQDDYLLMIKKDPGKAIRSLWLNYLAVNVNALDAERGFIPGLRESLLREIGVLRDAEIFAESFAANAVKLDGISAGLLGFRDLKLMNVMLEDDTEIVMLNRIDLSVLEYFDQNVEIFSAIEALYKKQSPCRFHMPPDAIELHLS